MERELIEQISLEAIAKNGEVAQMQMAMEECAELIVAINHFLRHRASEKEVITEIADVRIMCGQLTLLFGKQKVSKEIERKINRLEERLSQKEIQQ